MSGLTLKMASDLDAAELVSVRLGSTTALLAARDNIPAVVIPSLVSKDRGVTRFSGSVGPGYSVRCGEQSVHTSTGQHRRRARQG